MFHEDGWYMFIVRSWVKQESTREEWMRRKRLVLGVGGGRLLPPSGLLLESTFRCQSPGGIRKLCRMLLIFYPQHPPVFLPLLPSDQHCISVGVTASHFSLSQNGFTSHYTSYRYAHESKLSHNAHTQHTIINTCKVSDYVFVLWSLQYPWSFGGGWQ